MAKLKVQVRCWPEGAELHPHNAHLEERQLTYDGSEISVKGGPKPQKLADATIRGLRTYGWVIAQTPRVDITATEMRRVLGELGL